MVGICRLCAGLRKVDVLTTITDPNHVVCRKLRECCQINIQMDDALPKCICCDCLEALQQAHSFYIKVHESQESLITLFSHTARVDNGNTLNTTKPRTLAESLALVIPLTSNNATETEASTDAGCVGGGNKELKPEVHAIEEEEGSETTIIQDDEVNLRLEKVEKEIDDEVYLIEKMLGRKCNEENEEEFILLEMPKKTVPLSNKPHTAEKYGVDIETAHTYSVDEEEEVRMVEKETEEEEEEGEENEYEDEEEEEQETMEEDQNDEKGLEDGTEQEVVQEEVPMKLQLSTQAAGEVQLDTWNAYPWLCYICSVEETSFIDLLLHYQVAHNLQSSNEMQFKCVDCKKICQRYYSFVNHVRFRHRATLTLCCDVCNTICSDFQGLAIHRQEQHTKNTDYPLILLCGDCGHGYKDQNSRQIHSKIHSQSGIKYECKNCGKHFARYVAWKTHLKVHSEIKEFSCEQCGKSFRQKVNLLTHLLTHVVDRPYDCSICQKNFKSAIILENHMKRHSSVKKFKCDYCENMFRTKDAKLSHERTHTGEKPFKCGYCERSYRFRSTFIAHQNTHTGNRPYSCEPCNHHFTNWSNYNKHMIRRHDNETAAKDENKERRPTVKDNKKTNANKRFVYEILEEVVDSPESVLHEEGIYTVPPESVENTLRIIEVSTISASNSECEKVDENLENFYED